MARWRYKIKLNEAIERNNEAYDLSRHEEDMPEEAKEMLAVQCEAAPPLAHFAPRIRAAKSIAAVNRLLHKVFDEADERLVWCGGI